ncbi:hypothetical protein HYR99_22170 [Candidatus Poribacteria bacterium]|nr:hypothetical protein [Candidatus Poribacteria bacterium]
MATCKACNAEIKWIRTEKGKQMPVDAKPITVITELGKTIRAYVPHWASCPGAETFRKASNEAA